MTSTNLNSKTTFQFLSFGLVILSLTGCVKLDYTETLNKNGTSSVIYDIEVVEAEDTQKNEVISFNVDNNNFCDGINETELASNGGIVRKCINQSKTKGRLEIDKYDFSFALSQASDGILTYNLREVFNSYGNGSAPSEQDKVLAEMMTDTGASLKYTLISPWPILSHTHGEKVTENRLNIDWFKIPSDEAVEVKLDARGEKILILNQPVKAKIESMVKGLETKLKAANISNEIKNKYLESVIDKIHLYSERAPEKEIYLGYLEQKLIELKPEATANFNSELPALVRNSATIIKTTRAVEFISSFILNSAEIKSTLKSEAAYELPADLLWYGHTSDGKNFFFLGCNTTTNEAVTDGTTESTTAVKANVQICSQQPIKVENHTVFKIQ